LLVASLALFQLGSTLAEDHPGGVPALDSRPGAAYTVYLNVAGFNYTGTWPDGATPLTPGFTPALNDVSDTGTFNAAEQEQIKAIWARMAQSYVGLDVNVTTVDPAVAAGQASSDAARQAFYDNTPNLMHTIIGSGLRDHDANPGTPDEPWVAGADGISGLNVVSGTATTNGGHTNFMLSENQAGPATGFVINGDYIGAISAHENGHAFGLYHQSDYTGNTLVNEYSLGDAAGGNGSYVAIMGQASDRQRVTWRVGDSDNQTPAHTENDIAVMLALNAGLTLVEDGIGHTRPTATPLPLAGSTVDFTSAHGVIVPSDMGNPTPAATTEDWFSFTLSGTSTISLTAHNSTQFLTPGEADGVGTLRSKLTIFDVDGIFLMDGAEAVDTLLTTYTGTLNAGTYYAQISALSPHDQDSPSFNDAQYYNMGAYFLTGDGFTQVPEPGAIVLFACGALMVCFRRSRSSNHTFTL